jgi:hypothetical protein
VHERRNKTGEVVDVRELEHGAFGSADSPLISMCPKVTFMGQTADIDVSAGDIDITEFDIDWSRGDLDIARS